MAAAALGIRNLLMLKGDDPEQGDQPDAKPVFDLDTVGLTQLAVHMRDRNELPHGRKLAASRLLHRGGRHADRSAGRLGAEKPARPRSPPAAQFAADPVLHGCRRCCAATWRGSPSTALNLPMLIGISPLRSAKSARWMREKLYGTIIPDEIVERMEAAADPAAEGRRICVDL